MRSDHLETEPSAAARTRRALGLILIAAASTIALAVPSVAAAAPVPRPAGKSVPASIGGPASGTVAVHLAAVGIDLCAQDGYNAGFRGSYLVTAVAVAMAESRCNPGAVGSNPGDGGHCPYGSLDRGLWQINSCWHPEVSEACAYDAQCNANAAYAISSGGTSWSQWSTYVAGTYLSYISSAQAAVNRLGTGNPPSTVPGTILASPSLNVRSGPGTGYGSVGQANYYDTVNISCWTTGDYVSGGYWPSSTWDRISDPVTGANGYAADTWISTTSDVKSMVGHC